MDFMIAWFIPLKLLSLALIGGLVYLAIKHKFYKVAGAIVIIMLMIAQFVKIDGTNSKSYHKIQESQMNSKYESIDTEITTVKKVSFDERMKLEDNRSLQADKVVENEINK